MDKSTFNSLKSKQGESKTNPTQDGKDSPPEKGYSHIQIIDEPQFIPVEPPSNKTSVSKDSLSYSSTLENHLNQTDHGGKSSVQTKDSMDSDHYPD